MLNKMRAALIIPLYLIVGFGLPACNEAPKSVVKIDANDSIRIMRYALSVWKSEYENSYPTQIIVSTTSPIVMQGDNYLAEILMGRYINPEEMQVFVNDKAQKITNGSAKYEARANSLGEKSLAVKIRYKRKGEWQEVKTSTSYTVVAGNASLEPDFIYLYIGVSNPLSLTGGPFKNVRYEATPGLEIEEDRGSYLIVKPSNGTREATITIYADGKKVGDQHFIVRPLPNPEVLLGSKTGGNITKAELLAMKNVFAGLGATFAFEGMNYKIKSFTAIFIPKQSEPARQVIIQEIEGNAMPDTMLSVFAAAEAGDRVVIADVKVIDPDGKFKTLNGPSFTVK